MQNGYHSEAETDPTRTGAESSAKPTDKTRQPDERLDINPGFPSYAGRTSLAKVRDYLSERRSLLAIQRTAMAKGRTGLAFFRTGIALLTIAMTFTRLFGTGIGILTLDVVLSVAGLVMLADGLIWYIPVRRDAARDIGINDSQREAGVTVLAVEEEREFPRFVSSGVVPDADKLRAGWSLLSPVQRRRFLANDRTDMAEERTVLASLRTTMARSRMGLAFTRSGVAFTGLGIALIKRFPIAGWNYFDIFLIVVGIAMALEGFYWYLPGYRAGRNALKRFRDSLGEKTIWDFEFPPLSRFKKDYPPLKASHSPGIWGTTGLALERTVLAERRNLMSRLRTVMAYSRNGLAFIRTGASISAVGAGLIAFLTGSIGWTLVEAILIIMGLALIVDGWRWFSVSEKIKEQFPYCYGDFEIAFPKYGIPANKWKQVTYSADEPQ